MKIPQKYLDAIGTDQTFEGAIFGKKLIQETTFKILDVRFGHGYIIDMQKFEAGLPCQKHPTIEFLVKNETMPRSRWTTGFPCREIDINNLT